MKDSRLNKYLDNLEGYPLLDPKLEDLQWGLLNWYHHNFAYFWGMAKQFCNEALQALVLHRNQHDKMIAAGYKLDPLDVAIPANPPVVKSEESMEVDNN